MTDGPLHTPIPPSRAFDPTTFYARAEPIVIERPHMPRLWQIVLGAVILVGTVVVIHG